ncbi:MAG: hypothetical protein R3320_10585, partial [Nitriliruptorales bacterium]|nr:hypothetical protein [Nitriliruptorales bacterium]
MGWQRLGHLAAVLASCLVLTACGDGTVMETAGTPAPTRSGPPTVEDDQQAAEIILSRHGGLCPEVACHFEVSASEQESSWTATGTGVAPATGSVDPGTVRELELLLLARFDELTEQPFEEECPTAYDGQELSITVRLLPTGPDAHLRDAQVFHTTSCTHAWPDGAVREIAMPGMWLDSPWSSPPTADQQPPYSRPGCRVPDVTGALVHQLLPPHLSDEDPSCHPAPRPMSSCSGRRASSADCSAVTWR